MDGIYAAKEAVNDSALLGTCPLIVKGIVEVVDTLRERIAVLDEAIEKAFAGHEDAWLFSHLPGAGPALMPRLLVAFGTNRERWENASALQSFSGIAPVTVSSGNSEWVHRRFACPKFVRQTFHEFAGHSIQRSVWARANYDQQIGKGKSTTPSSALWRSSGSASCSAAGKTVPPMTRQSTCRRWRSIVLH